MEQNQREVLCGKIILFSNNNNSNMAELDS